MTTSTPDLTETAPLEATQSGDAPFVRRSAFYLQGNGAPIFAWLHQLENTGCVNHCVIICPPIGYEQLHSHRALRHLADSLARASIPTLRFDWNGTGDSPGNDEDPGRYSTWLADIRDAATWMREQLGYRQISLIGLRLGATLGALATESIQIDNLILWSPVVKGRSYVREMRALGLTSEAPVRRSASSSSDIESGGFILSAETVADVGAIDLLKVVPKCRQLLVVSRSDLPEDDRLSQQYAGTGLLVRQIACPGYAEMMLDPHRGQLPDVAIREITEWMTDAIKSDANVPTASDPAICIASMTGHTNEGVRATMMTGTALTSNPAEIHGQTCESPLRLSSRPDLFGIVTEPASDSGDSLPTIVLLNSGSAYRIGASRMNVLLARHLASQGFRCLRMDFSGLGDSVAECPSLENDSYTPTMFRDIDLALKQVEHQFRATRFVLIGLCSGAYAAFQSAVQVPNPALIEAVLINPLTFFWTEGMTLETSPTKHLMSFHQYQNSALDPRKWWKLLTGKSKLGIRGALELAGRRFGLLKWPSPTSRLPQIDGTRSNMITHPVREDLPGDLKRIQRANRHLAMFFSTSDPGYSILNCHASRKANELRASGRLSITFIEEADHTFTVKAARNELIHEIASHLRKRYQ